MIFYGIYKTINLINGKMYIGKHQTTNINDQYLGSGKILKHAIHKYGKQNFKREWIMFCETKDEMDMMERLLVDETWVLRSDTYNICLGGEGGHTWLGKAPFQGRHHTNEMKMHMKKMLSGKNNPNYGKKFSFETRYKISQARRGKPSSMKGKKCSNISKAILGHSVSAETRAKISKANKGNKAWNSSIVAPVLQLTKDNKIVKEWPSKFEAEKQLHLYHIERALRGERNTVGGFKWIYSIDFKNLKSNIN